jgi:ABC-2 type transport system ATP-binding protein
MAAIEVRELVRTYGPVRAVDGIDFSVSDGEIFALLGPNGAGKTTTVEILEGYRTRNAGSVRVLGVDPATAGADHRARIGVVLQSAGFEEEFTVRELVRLQTRLYPRGHDADDLIALVGLGDKRAARVKGLSGGQRRRLDLALGLAGAPDLLFLDEPTTGFDPAARHHAWDLIAALRERGTTILLTTHYLEEAQQLADRVAVMRDGRLVATGTPTRLRAGCDLPTTISFGLPPGVEASDLPVLSAPPTGTADRMSLSSHTPVTDSWRLTGWAHECGLELPEFTVSPPTLEDVYLALTEGRDG